MTSGDPILVCDGVDVAYGPVQVLFGLDLTVDRGEIVALLGTNGAGKSTLLKAVSGLVKAKAGTIVFDGEDITGVPAHRTAERGLVQMPGGKGVFPQLSVRENLRLACWLFRDDKERTDAKIDEVLTLFPRLKERYRALAGDMSGGEQQMLTLGMALVNEPKLLMIDELSLGLAPTIVGDLIGVVHDIHATGVTIIVVEQSINVALTLAQRAVFMEKGEFRFTGATAELLERPDILRSVFIAGASVGSGDEEVGGETRAAAEKTKQQLARQAPGADAGAVLECHHVLKRFGGIVAVDGVSIGLRRGEILGLIGQNGAGKTTLFDCISGYHRIDAGRIELSGHDITDWEPHERARARLGRSFQEAMLYPSLTVAETIATALERHLANHDIFAAALAAPASYESELAAWLRVEELVELMSLQAYRDKLVGELSTGSRRIVELACILAQEPSVLLLDEPSGGVAQRETEALGPMLLRVQEATGCSILVIEHDMPLLSSICDRMYCLELGQVIAEGTPEEVLNHPRVIESYLGENEAAISRSGAAAPKPRAPRRRRQLAAD
ncbi:MAG TPA: ATP-binding cassette domain-containing protein [Acidimicrobiales bacterium]|nr:ATP-binding cassette domain-containing protein [Acidimicrobiales bacterium]